MLPCGYIPGVSHNRIKVVHDALQYGVYSRPIRVSETVQMLRSNRRTPATLAQVSVVDLTDLDDQ